MAGTRDPAINDVEAWFVERGVPHFAVDSAPTRAVLRRAAPVLVAYLVVTLLMTASFAWSFEVNLVAIAVAVIVVGIAWAIVNVLRGRHWRSLPRRFGPLEVAAFLLIPCLPPLIVGFQLSDALLTVIVSALFLAAVYVATSFGGVGAVRWAFGRARAQGGSIGRLLTRALPLLMVFIAFAFLQSDTWQVMAALDWQTVLARHSAVLWPVDRVPRRAPGA
jgi:FtsH-binding integral membrane protein